MEHDLTKHRWNPDTCDCRIEVTKETTAEDGVEELASIDDPTRVVGRVPTLVRGKAGDWVYLVKKYRTVRVDKTGAVLLDQRHAALEPHPPPGDRLRGRIVKACSDPAHRAFLMAKTVPHPVTGDPVSAVVQTQRGKCSLVCECVWEDLFIGDRQEGGLFGNFLQQKCEGHKNLPDGKVKGAIQAYAAKIMKMAEPLIKEGRTGIIIPPDHPSGTQREYLVDEMGKVHLVPLSN